MGAAAVVHSIGSPLPCSGSSKACRGQAPQQVGHSNNSFIAGWAGRNSWWRGGQTARWGGSRSWSRRRRRLRLEEALAVGSQWSGWRPHGMASGGCGQAAPGLQRKGPGVKQQRGFGGPVHSSL